MRYATWSEKCVSRERYTEYTALSYSPGNQSIPSLYKYHPTLHPFSLTALKQINMKRQRGPIKVEDMAAAMPTTGKKKAKKLLEGTSSEHKVGGNGNGNSNSNSNINISVKKVDEMIKKENSITSEGFQQGSNNVDSSVNWEEYMPWINNGGGMGMVDEQMSWGSTWFPALDMDLYSDVVWDDDIWNLRTVPPLEFHNHHHHTITNNTFLHYTLG